MSTAKKESYPPDLKGAFGFPENYFVLVYSSNQWIAISARSDCSRNSEYPWIFTVLGRDSKWLLVFFFTFSDSFER